MARIKYDSSLEIVENACCYCFPVARYSVKKNIYRNKVNPVIHLTDQGQMALKEPSIIKY